MSKSSYEKFEERYEQDADASFRALSEFPVETLLELARSGEFGDTHQLWPAIASKVTLHDAGWTLFEVLVSDADYLSRYHCGSALIKLAENKLTGWTPVMLSAGPPNVLRENLEKIRTVLEAAIGKRFSS